MKENKNHWYDGKFYDKFIAPNQDKSFDIVKTLIDKYSSVLDFGCGTGRLGLQLTSHCKIIDGIDLSYRNIEVAKTNLKNTGIVNVRYFHTNIDTFLKNENSRYDYAVLSYVLHEVRPVKRTEILKKISGICEKTIIVDYLVPRPCGFTNILNEFVEFFAGTSHYRNFKSYVKTGGIKGLAEKSGLKIIKEIENEPVTAHIAILTKL
ncbi:MAG: class I SAM-dependent methyltransferase [Ignavibacteria bacterium]|nr:class I SAM-dependent methyltransferase [Ignavibacteria bacterium]